MNFPFAYFFYIYFDGHVHSIYKQFKMLSINILDAININLGIPDDPKEIKLVNNLTVQERKKFTTLLTKY